MEQSLALKIKIQNLWHMSNIYEINSFNNIVGEAVERLEKEIEENRQEAKNEKGYLKYFQIELKNKSIQAVLELKIINEYRHLELCLTRLLIKAYDLEENIKFPNWDSFFDFLKKQKNISDIKNTEGYPEANGLRKTTSVLKHSVKGLLEDKRTKDIAEFRDNEIFDVNLLEKFYERVRPKVLIFVKSFADKVVKNLKENEGVK